ncbi:MAG: hypothetical protein ACREQV_13235 [Candidatus Binatia bacterium]
MPKLHRYKSRDKCYVLTSIRGKVITFQLTPEGERKLSEAGVEPDQKFLRALLLDLWRTGDAFTGGSSASESDPASIDQLELDFAQDPDPETAFPACEECDSEECDSIENLHLSVLRESAGLVAKLQCSHHRDVTSHTLEVCIPIHLVSLQCFGRLMDMNPVTKKYTSVLRYENLLRMKLESKWEAVRKLRGALQQSLFETGLGW